MDDDELEVTVDISLESMKQVNVVWWLNTNPMALKFGSVRFND